jgi:hypothetical protein
VKPYQKGKIEVLSRKFGGNVMKRKMICLIMLICLFFSCEKKNVDRTVVFDGYVTLKMNETVVDTNNTMSVSFVEVSDNRCLKSSCYLCYGSKADVLLSVSNSENAKIEIKLSMLGCVDELDNEFGNNHIDTLGYRFKVVKLSPYPDIEPIKNDDYFAKIKISKL